MRYSSDMRQALFFILILFSAGCAYIFGWNIHAPGVLSQNYFNIVASTPQRIALFLPEETTLFQSQNRGGRFADPQTYYVGESFTPMAIEAFQHAFEEFIFLEVDPTPELLRQYAIAYVAVVNVSDFNNRVTLKGQAVGLETVTTLFDASLTPVARFEASGSSDAQKVFAKKGGPEVNLNAAIERNLLAVVESIQDLFVQP